MIKSNKLKRKINPSYHNNSANSNSNSLINTLYLIKNIFITLISNPINLMHKKHPKYKSNLILNSLLLIINFLILRILHLLILTNHMLKILFKTFKNKVISMLISNKPTRKLFLWILKILCLLKKDLKIQILLQNMSTNNLNMLGQLILKVKNKDKENFTFLQVDII
jgi:hypothetical protein